MEMSDDQKASGQECFMGGMIGIIMKRVFNSGQLTEENINLFENALYDITLNGCDINSTIHLPGINNLNYFIISVDYHPCAYLSRAIKLVFDNKDVNSFFPFKTRLIIRDGKIEVAEGHSSEYVFLNEDLTKTRKPCHINKDFIIDNGFVMVGFKDEEKISNIFC